MRITVLLLTVAAALPVEAFGECRPVCKKGESRDTGGCCRAPGEKADAPQTGQTTKAPTTTAAPPVVLGGPVPCGDRAVCVTLCGQNIAAACHRLGQMHAEGINGAPDAVQAVTSFQRACELGLEDGCFSLAERAKDQAGVKRILKEVCDKGSPSGCGRFARVLTNAAETAAEGEQLAQAACDKGAAVGCEVMGDRERAKKSPQSLVKARGYYEQACKAGLATACAQLGVMVGSGQGGEADDLRALSVFSHVCDIDHEGNQCARGGYVYAAGVETDSGRIAKDPERAASLYRRAFAIFQTRCDAGSLKACHELATMIEPRPQIDPAWGSPKDGPRARSLYQQACNGGWGNACNGYAAMLREGQGGPVDAATALSIFRQRCDGADADNVWACAEGGVLASQQSNWPIAIQMWTRGCSVPRPYPKDWGRAHNCNNLGNVYRNGWGVTADAAKAEQYTKIACENDLPDACSRLPKPAPPPPPKPQGRLISWKTTASELGNGVGQRFQVVCPPYGAQNPVWGSGPYTSDSSICTAAAHAGVIAMTDGGAVTVTLREGRDSFAGSTQNGLTTSGWDSYPSTFSVAPALDPRRKHELAEEERAMIRRERGLE